MHGMLDKMTACTPRLNNILWQLWYIIIAVVYPGNWEQYTYCKVRRSHNRLLYISKMVFDYLNGYGRGYGQRKVTKSHECDTNIVTLCKAL